MGGDRRTVTMLMADLRGFSSASERQPPEQVLKFLNQYLEIMTDVINCYQGTIDEFMGDGILVLFGAPTTRDDDPDRAMACAIAMQFAVIEGKQIQAKRTDRLLHQVSSQGALLQSPVAIALFSNLKLNLDSPDRTADFYAKVMAEVSGRADSLTYQVRFTFIPPDVLNGLAPLQ